MVTAIDTDVRATLCARWRSWCLGAAAALALATPALAQPSPNDVIGYADADRSGATTTWTLADGVPYLFVPYVGAEVAGSVAAVETGAGVGAILFQRPYFGTRDVGCNPELGSDARPDLRWRGATARFSPPVGAEPSTDAPGQNAASLIIYRKDLGPPPGVLLLNRRLTLGTACAQAVHKTFFDRIFVPLAAPPEPARCYNLTGTYRQDGGKDIRVNFASADRVALLQPADLDDRYRSLRHRFRAILYDGEGCRGGGGEFRSEGQEPGNIKLDPIGLRDRVRSVRIVYEGGPLAPYYVVPTAKPVAEAPVAEAPVAEAPVAKAPVAEKSPGPQPAAAPPKAQKAEIAPNTAKSAAVPAPVSQPTPPPSDIVSAPAPAPAPVLALTPAPAPKKRDELAIARAQSPASPLYAALPAPRLKLPSAKPPAPAPSAASKTFEYPVQDIYRLNFCLRWGVDCGEPAATAWCQAQGFAKASAWRIDKDIGSLFPTIVLADKRVCAQFPCDGFEEITCINEERAPRPVRQTTISG